MVKLLLERKVAVNLEDRKGLTPLNCAISDRRGQDIVVLLVRSRADVNAMGTSGSMLHRAAQGGDNERAKILITELGALVNLADMDKRTPLHWACNAGNLDVAMTLCDNKAE